MYLPLQLNKLQNAATIAMYVMNPLSAEQN